MMRRWIMKSWMCLALAVVIIVPARLDADAIVFNTEDYPPYNFLDESGQLDGVVTRLLEAALDELSVDVEMRLLPWARAYTEAQMRDGHCVFSTAYTEEREPLFQWVGPLGEIEWAAFALRHRRLDAGELSDLSGLRVGSFREDAVANYVSEQGIDVSLTTTDQENIARLRDGQIDVWVSGVLSAEYLARIEYVDLDRLFTLNRADIYLACHPDVSGAFLSDLQAVVTELKADGSAERIREDVLNRRRP